MQILLASQKYFLTCYKHKRYIQRFLFSFIRHYLCLSIFCCTLWGNFWKARKHITVFERIHGGYSRSYFNLFFFACAAHKIMHTLHMLCTKNKSIFVHMLGTKNKSIFDGSKDRLKKYWFNIPNFMVKNLSLVLFYHLKT